MAERSLRGSRLGAQSMETDENVVPSERKSRPTCAPTGTPPSFPSPSRPRSRTPGSAAAVRRPAPGRGPEPEAKPVKHVRTHWDMLLERRSIPELEELLEERLDPPARVAWRAPPQAQVRLTDHLGAGYPSSGARHLGVHGSRSTTLTRSMTSARRPLPPRGRRNGPDAGASVPRGRTRAARGPRPHRPEQAAGDDGLEPDPGDRPGERQDEEEADDVGEEARARAAACRRRGPGPRRRAGGSASGRVLRACCRAARRARLRA